MQIEYLACNMKVTTAIIHDTRRQIKDGTYPVKLRITYSREQKYYPTPYSLSIEDFEKTQGNRPRQEFKDISLRLQASEKKANDIIKDLPIFKWELFEKQYLTTKIGSNTLNEAFSKQSEDFRKEGRIGTAVSYECAQSSLNKFMPRAKFTDVNVDFLKKYERWMLNNGNSVTTVSMYLRSLRALFNNAISEGSITTDFYPFGKRRYEIPTGNNIKKSLTLEDLASIYYYKPKGGTSAEKAKDYWFFMYLCNGINVKDLCLLKYDNIKDDILEYQRAKTAHTKRNVEHIRVPITEDMREIINRWGNKPDDGNTYIFPVLKQGLTPERQRQLIQQFTRVINDHMKVIAEALNLKGDVTTYAARHSFATILKRSGASTEFIGEALGHSNVKTTQNYLAGFEDKSKREVTKALTAFKKL
ncbi:MAG: recombinase XerD [Segetibacter sp.]|nr:recombinase XerD [Segetibacter sp.]